METDDIIETGGDYEEEQEWENEYDETEEQVEAVSEVKPELKRLYQQHPECNLDYIEQVIPKIPLQVIPPGGEKADVNRHQQHDRPDQSG